MSPTRRGVSWNDVRGMAMKLPGVEDGASYGTPAIKVKGKLMARLKEDGESIALRVDLAERDILLELDPRAFFVTDHYLAYPWVLVRLESVRVDHLEELISDAWRQRAPKKLLDAHDAEESRPAAGTKKK